MTFGREADHRVVLTDAINHKGAEDGLCGRTKSVSHRARQIEMESWLVACLSESAHDLQWVDIIHYGITVGSNYLATANFKAVYNK